MKKTTMFALVLVAGLLATTAWAAAGSACKGTCCPSASACAACCADAAACTACCK